MENQASTSSGDIDQRRRDALIGYRNVSSRELHGLYVNIYWFAENAGPCRYERKSEEM